MSFEAFPQYPPVDGELVDRIVCKLKSQGIFDQFRKDCLADVDTKPAYQNLQQRVNGTVATFLATQTWQQDLNKTQLRESLRRHVQQGFLEVGVDRIVDQVVNPKVFTVFMPKVEDVVYDCLGIEKPKHPPPSNNLLSGHKLTLLDLLPKDLDPVSPDSDNLSFNDDETKDETNNNESSSKLDISHDSQVSGISDLSSHMGDSFKEAQENHIDSNTGKSIASAKENSTEPHFENFENLSEKIKQAEIGGHNSATSSLLEEQDNSESKVTLEVDQDLQKDNRDETLMEIDSVSNSTFEDAKIFTNKIIKEDTCSRTLSEDSLSCSSFNSKFKKEKSKSVIIENNGNSMDKSEVDNPCKELSSDEVNISSVNDDVDIKNEERVMENKEVKKTDEPKDKKHRDSSSSKTSKSSRPSDSKHRSSFDKKDDIKQNKEKDKEKSNKDDKDRSSRHKDDRHHSSKDKYKDKDRNDRNREKDSDKKKDKSDHKDSSEKDKKNDKDKHKERDRNDKDKTRSEKENHKYEKDKIRSEKDKDRNEKEKDKHEKTRREKDKEKREKDKNDSKEKDKDSNYKDKDKNDKEKSRERDRGKSEKDYKNEKDKENRSADDKVRDEKRRDSKKYDKSSSTSSVKKDDNYKIKKNEENSKEKTLNSKLAKNEDEKRERKRKSERCNDEIKLKEARRSWDRDSSGGNGKGHGSHKSNNSEYKVSSSSSSTKEKRTGESSNQQKGNERRLEPDGDTEEPSDVDKILMKINSSIEESQNIQSNDEQAIKKPKIARNIFEIKKIMLARKNIARQAFKQDKKRKEMMDSIEKVDSTDSPSTTKPPTRDNPKTREENKENIKTEQMDKLKNPKVGLVKGKFTGFHESDIEQSRNSLQIFRSHFSNFCTSMGMELLPTENIEKIDYSKICDLSDDLLDDNLNKLKPKPVSLERRKTLPDEKQVSKAVENIMNGKNGCYVLLKDCCTEVVEAMRNVTQPPINKSTKRPVPSKPQSSSAIDEDCSKSHSRENLKGLDRSPKKETLSSPVKLVSQPPAIVATDVVTEILCHTSQQHLKEQGNWAKKSAVRSSPTRQQPTENKEEEPFSPVADVTIALNTYLNDSKEILPSVPLTEAMLDNLMQQSSIILEDETFADSDDSMHESDSVIKPVVSAASNFEREESSIRTSSDIYFSSDVDQSDDVTLTSTKNSLSIDSSACDIFSHNKDSNEETSETKVIKRRNQRVCRSASQRYDSTDLYKPRPVLPQNSKRVRTPRSVSSEDVSSREQYECTPSRKRAR